MSQLTPRKFLDIAGPGLAGGDGQKQCEHGALTVQGGCAEDGGGHDAGAPKGSSLAMFSLPKDAGLSGGRVFKGTLDGVAGGDGGVEIDELVGQALETRVRADDVSYGRGEGSEKLVDNAR